MIINRERYQKAFALPTVLITSAVMMIILLVGLSSVSSISVSLNQQYYDKLIQEATDSGLTMAKACMHKVGAPTWSDTSPLHPNTGCGGGASCTNSDQCYVLSDGNVKTTFTVGTATMNVDGSYSVPVSAQTQLLRTSNGAVWRTYSDKTVVKVIIGWKQIGGMHFTSTCGLTLLDTLYCWGSNSSGQLGNGTTTNSTVPVAVDTSGVLSGKTITSVTAAGASACAVTADRWAYCWGNNNKGQLGNGTTTNSSVPVAVSRGAIPTGVGIASISPEFVHSHTCAVGTDKKAYCWGYNNYGNLGNGTTTDALTPIAVSTAGVLKGVNITQVSTGDLYTCALSTAGKAYCWGDNLFGDLGNGNNTDSTVPVAVTMNGALSGKTIKSLAGGNCALASDNQAYCWGGGSQGQLGNNAASSSNVPVAVYTSGALSGKTLTKVIGSHITRCGLASDDRLYCWGSNDGTFGNGLTDDQVNAPQEAFNVGPMVGKTIKDAGFGWSASYVLTTSNFFYAAGFNYYGPFGNGTTNTTSLEAVPILGGSVDESILY